MVEDSAGALASGEAVRAFYHANDHPQGFRFVRMLDGSPEVSPETLDHVAIGLSTGWIPATIAEEWSPKLAAGRDDDRVLVRLHGRFIDAYKKDGPDPVDGLYWKVSRACVRRMGAPQPQADLSLLVVRWFDYYNKSNQRSASHNVANEKMLLDVLQEEGSPHAAFAEAGRPGRYEVHSAFVRSTADLELIGVQVAASMRGRRRAALYFLWPTQRPSVEIRMPGCVGEAALFPLMDRMEGAGVRTCWPHNSKLYRELSGKTWVPRMSRGRPDMRVPATASLTCADFDKEPLEAAEKAIAELQAISGQRDAATCRGVAKLGFSWMGEDVRPFTGAAELAKVLTQFFDGATPATMCLVQERVDNVVCELRFICMRDMAEGPDKVKKEIVRMCLHPPRHNDETFALTSANTMSAAEATAGPFRGNAEALRQAEQEAEALADRWLKWFVEEGHGLPTVCRLDFLVTLSPQPQSGGANNAAAPTPQVWTLELCECGGSLCNLSVAARATACTNELVCGAGNLDGEALPAGFPKPLPVLRLPEVTFSAPAQGGEYNKWSNSNSTWQRGGQKPEAPRAYRGDAPRPRSALAPGGDRGRRQASGPGPLTALLARLGIGEEGGGRVVLGALLAVIALLWRMRRR